MQGEPRVMQDHPQYVEVVAEVSEFLAARRQACIEAGIPEGQILLDPGFGFGKTLAHNLTLLARLGELGSLGCPVLVGISRKSMLGALTGLPSEQRVNAGIAAAVLAIWQGARIIRTHDVQATVEAVKLATAAMQYRTEK